MQYLLTQDEIEAMAPKTELVLRDNALAMAREKLLALADFDCIHKEGGRNKGGYCDDCPCSPVADIPNYEAWERVCWLNKSYSQ